MHNGVGLPTARGSGTSGRVQSNRFIIRGRPSPSPSSPAAPATTSVPGGARGGIREEMAEHQRKRALESRMLELREALEEQGYTDAQADARVAEARKAAEEEAPEQPAAKEERWPKGTPL
jgi:serine/arginine repetitive matrix protein 2